MTNITRSLIDRLVVVVAIASATFGAGMWVGESRRIDPPAEIPAYCPSQPGHKLVSTEHSASGVFCHYAKAYGKYISKVSP